MEYISIYLYTTSVVLLLRRWQKMSNYGRLKELSKKYKGKEAIELAREFGINICDETTCNNAFTNSNNPLLCCDAVLAMIGNKYVVYYKEGK